MLRSILIFIICSQTLLAAKLSLDDRRKKILGIVDEELQESNRLARQQQFKAPDTILRIAELNLEKARLYREVENEQYLAIPPEERARLNKEDYFRQSTKYFLDSNKAALLVEKNFKRFQSLGEAYYILGYNYKELGKHEEAQKYFSLSSTKATDPKLVLKSKLILADYYYNDKKFAKAIPLYEASLGKVDERWWTKDAFNLAWSYYRVKKYNDAISLMLKVHKKSGGKYVDMRSQVERDIGIFYVDANRINEATEFFTSQGLDFTDQFIKIANSITSQGRFEQAEKLLKKVAANLKNQEKKVDIKLAELNLYDKFNKIPEHLEASRELVLINKKSPLKKDQIERLSFQVNKKAAELQKASTSGLYKDLPKARKEKANQAISYFQLAGQISPDELAEKTFFQAETAYASGDYKRAIQTYINSFDSAKDQKNSKIQKQSLEGMLSSLGQDSLDKGVADKYYIPVYTRYLTVDSKSKRASTIYVKLFNSQIDAGDITGSEKTLTDFANNFPDDFKTQEGMLAKVMDHYRKNKDYSTVKAYVKRINSGEFKVSTKYADALRNLMTKIQIEGVQQSLEKGEKGVALKGYHQIYDSSESTSKAKANAAYNLSALYYELGNISESHRWAQIALELMTVSDVVKFADSFISMSAGYFLRQNFESSSNLSHEMIVKICRENIVNKSIAFKNAVFIALANNDLDKALQVRETGKNCSINDQVMAEVTLEVLKDLAKDKRWETYESLMLSLESNTKMLPQLIRPYEELRKQYIESGNLEEAKIVKEKQIKFYQESKSKRLDIPVEALDLVADRVLSNVKDKKKRLDEIVLGFPEDVFNKAVKEKLRILDDMTSEVNVIQKIGSGKGIVQAYRYVIEAYEEFGNSLKNFAPEGKSPEYVESFKKAMADVHGPILQNARKQRSEIKKLIYENKILSLANYEVLFPEDKDDKRYITPKEAILMDRGGRK